MSFSKKSLIIFSFLLVASCAHTQKVENIAEVINLNSLEPVKQKGTYLISINKADTMSGNAQIIGNYCSAYSYPYDFSSNFDNVVEQVSEKAFENSEVLAADIKFERHGTKDIFLEMQPIKVYIMCIAKNGFSWDCTATSNIKGTVKIHDTASTDKIYKVSGQNSSVATAGLVCEGGSAAVSKAIGKSLNNFAAELYAFFTEK